MSIKKIISKILILIFIASPMQIFAFEFNPNNILSDFTYTNYDSMSVDEIQFFLTQKGSGLATYKTEDIDGTIKTAAEIIYQAANDHKINPKFLIVLLQKEQSLTETSNPTQYQFDWATGYARCDDPVACSPEAVAENKGFAKQVNLAAERNRFYIENSNNGWLKKANSLYEIDGYQITPVNQATANLYNYTPHYHGNYNFWKIWNRYFAKNYPDGTLLRSDNSDAVYLIEYGARRPFLNKAAFSSRFSSDKIITVSEDDISRYEIGTPIKFPNYTLMRDPSKSIYLLINDKKHRISSPEVFRKIGFIDDEIIDLSDEEINEYKNGDDITMKSLYPIGALLKDKQNKKIYYAKNGVKQIILNMAVLKSNYAGKEIIETEHSEIKKMRSDWPVKFKDGEIVKAKASPAVYVISNGKRRPIASGQAFTNLGYKWENIIETENKTLQLLHPIGEIIDMGIKSVELEEGTLVKVKNESAVYLVNNNKLRPILSGTIFETLGFKWGNVININESAINSYAIGETIDKSYNSTELAMR